MERFASLPGWYRAVLPALVALWATVTGYYWLGASGVSASGAAVSFERQHDARLLRIDDGRAFRVDRFGVNVVKYTRGVFPLCPLCGLYESAGTVMNLAEYRRGDWVYGAHAQPFQEAVNLKTGETIDVPVGTDLSQPPPEFVSRGLSFEPAHALKPEDVLASFPPLSTINESCVVFNLAFLVLVVPLLAFGLFRLLRGGKTA